MLKSLSHASSWPQSRWSFAAVPGAGATVRKHLGAVVVASLTLLFAAVAQAQGVAPPIAKPTAEQIQQMREKTRERMQEHQQVRLDRLSRKLALTSAQQGPWQNLVAVLRAMPEPTAPPAAGADAASLARGHATHLAEHARHASLVADAVGQLQAALSPEQRVTLNDAAWRLMRRGGPGMHGGPGHHGPGAPERHREGDAPAAPAPRG